MISQINFLIFILFYGVCAHQFEKEFGFWKCVGNSDLSTVNCFNQENEKNVSCDVSNKLANCKNKILSTKTFESMGTIILVMESCEATRITASEFCGPNGLAGELQKFSPYPPYLMPYQEEEEIPQPTLSPSNNEPPPCKGNESQPFKPTTLFLKGEYRWELLYNIDNLNNSGSFEATESITIKEEISFRRFYRSLKSAALQFHLVPVFDIYGIEVSGNIRARIAGDIEKLEETHSVQSREYFKSFRIVVGPYSTKTLYRLVFKAPGILYATDTLSYSQVPMSEVIVRCEVTIKPMLSGIDIVYSKDDAGIPSNALTEVNGGDSNINYGFENAKITYIVPRWTTCMQNAATGIHYIKQRTENQFLNNLAKGDRRDYRYLKTLLSPQTPLRISRVTLHRKSRTSINSIFSKLFNVPFLPKNKNACTPDMNKGRGGSYLYLCWKLVDTSL